MKTSIDCRDGGYTRFHQLAQHKEPQRDGEYFKTGTLMVRRKRNVRRIREVVSIGKNE